MGGDLALSLGEFKNSYTEIFYFSRPIFRMTFLGKNLYFPAKILDDLCFSHDPLFNKNNCLQICDIKNAITIE